MRPYVLYNEVFSSSYFAVVVSYQATRCKIRHKLSLFRHKIRCFDQWSISPTLYVRLFNSKLLNVAFLYLHLRFVLICARILAQKVLIKCWWNYPKKVASSSPANLFIGRKHVTSSVWGRFEDLFNFLKHSLTILIKNIASLNYTKPNTKHKT